MNGRGRLSASSTPRGSRHHTLERSVFVALFTAFLAAACRDHPSVSDGKRALGAASASNGASGARAPADAGTLPEDPEAGAQSSAEWHRHLDHEERERQLGYDRRKLPEHREVLKTLLDTRRSYDTAGSKRAVLAAEQAFKATLPKLDQRFDAIDHWGVSSKVLPDYRKLATTLADAYPNARIAALSGDTTGFEQLGHDMDTRLATIDAWLDEAAESEDE